ncbi:MAG: efflux RND transporter periplasmic adaptor subunit [Planctomycetaceae bacterium]|jgi:multidrug efflux system membrane fusion protein|nr:efflux RND transporter periplasmic adaptor subunit [Planctomycetaceae bacterium]
MIFKRIQLQYLFPAGIAVLCLVISTGCAKSKSGDAAAPGGAAVPLAEVITDAVKSDDVQLYLYERGQTEPYKYVDITARIPGYLEQILFHSGGLVKEGDKLAIIEQDQYKIALEAAKAQLDVSIARELLAKSNLDRSKELVESKTVSMEEFQGRQADYNMAKATVNLNKTAVQQAELNLQYTDIRAPFTGKATNNLVDIGNYVSPGSDSAKLLSIAQMDPIFIHFPISDKQFADLKERMGFRQAFDKSTDTAANGEAAAQADGENNFESILPPLNGAKEEYQARIDVSLTTGTEVLPSDFPLNGKIVAVIDNKITKETGQITLRAEVRNPLLTIDGNEDYMLYPGQICRVRIPYEKVKGAVLVAEEAILTDLDTKYVLVVEQEGDKSVIHRRDIRLGKLLDTQMRIVQNGLKPGENYVVRGVQRVRIGSVVKPVALEEYNKRRAAAEE